jgi:hypothetical protein
MSDFGVTHDLTAIAVGKALSLARIAVAKTQQDDPPE